MALAITAAPSLAPLKSARSFAPMRQKSVGTSGTWTNSESGRFSSSLSLRKTSPLILSMAHVRSSNHCISAAEASPPAALASPSSPMAADAEALDTTD